MGNLTRDKLSIEELEELYEMLLITLGEVKATIRERKEKENA